MKFRAERKQLRHILRPDEEILASDRLCAIEELPRLTVLSHPLLVVTDRSVYLILSGKEPEVSRIDLDALVEVRRTENPVPGSTLRLAADDGTVLTLTYEPRTRQHHTADLITEHFSGPVVSGTAGVDPP